MFHEPLLGDTLQTRVSCGFQRSAVVPTVIGFLWLKVWWARLDSSQGPTDYESETNLAILLARLAFTFVMVASFGRYLGPLVPKLFPSFSGEH